MSCGTSRRSFTSRDPRESSRARYRMLSGRTPLGSKPGLRRHARRRGSPLSPLWTHSSRGRCAHWFPRALHHALRRFVARPCPRALVEWIDRATALRAWPEGENGYVRHSGHVQHAVNVWAGIECSYNRVGDRYMDQVARSGLYDRPENIERLAGLGVTAIRVPVLWERWCALGERAWDWTDDVLQRLRRHGVTPIVGLVHHGSGPPGVSLDSEEFPERLAAFASETAERYPWVRYFTPVNEPLTTARFATLYGIWYPHAKTPGSFARAMITQVRAIAGAMAAIRRVTPSALLVQTEDLGKTYASRDLQYQADFENTRRWLTFDLLCGRVVGSHPMAAYLRWAGIADRKLDEVADAACQ